jgi:hypothetical protein
LIVNHQIPDVSPKEPVTYFVMLIAVRYRRRHLGELIQAII